jgi:hypothetical protein
MKRFFKVFSVILMIFLVAAAGMVAAVEYCAIKDGRTPQFLLGYGITLIPHDAYPTSFPLGDVMIIRQVPAQEIVPGETVLYTDAGSNTLRSGYIYAQINQDLQLLDSGSAIAASDVIGVYDSRIPHLTGLLDTVKTPLALCVYGAVLLLSIILWIALPGKRKPASGKLSRSDGEIASNLY